MFVEMMRTAIREARTLARMDTLSQDVWRAFGTEVITDTDASDLAELIHARRQDVRSAIEPVGIPAGRPSLFPPRRTISSPDRSESRDRRRRLSLYGPMPPQLGSRFTTGQLAVLQIVASEVAERGVCGLCVDAIAARAGVCRRLAQTAIRLAEGDGLLVIQERRHQGRKNDPNLVRIISREWLAWIKRRQRSRPTFALSVQERPGASSIGCKNLHPTDTGVKSGDKRRGGTRANAAGGQQLLSRKAIG